VEVHGNLVGRGVVIEVEDQGLGIEPNRLDELNVMLANPPDFNVMALSTETRVGLFVVARLAERHGIRISLRESAYGGTRAIVLIPASRIATVAPAEQTSPQQIQPEAPNGIRTVGGHPPVPAPAPAPVASAPAPAAAPAGRPPLPRRERQASLAPQLMAESAPAAEEVPGEEDPVRRSERLRATMSAFQQGTRQARTNQHIQHRDG
jgi:hypothetical protein